MHAQTMIAQMLMGRNSDIGTENIGVETDRETGIAPEIDTGMTIATERIHTAAKIGHENEDVRAIEM